MLNNLINESSTALGNDHIATGLTIIKIHYTETYKVREEVYFTFVRIGDSLTVEVLLEIATLDEVASCSEHRADGF